MKVRILAEAEDELFVAAQWYEDRESGIGTRLLNAFHVAQRQISERATTYSKLETVDSERDIRRCFLKRFPFTIVFELLEAEAVILAVAHSRRRPNYWSRRLNP